MPVTAKNVSKWLEKKRVVTLSALADEIAGAAELVMGKLDRVPVAIVRGLDAGGDGQARDLVMPAERNLFS